MDDMIFKVANLSSLYANGCWDEESHKIITLYVLSLYFKPTKCKHFTINQSIIKVYY